MNVIRIVAACAAFALTSSLAACGGQGGGGDPGPAAPLSYLRLQSDAGDYVGGGRAFEYTRADAQLSLNAVDGHLAVQVIGDERWQGDFVMPQPASRLEVGTYAGLGRYPFHQPATGGLSWSGEGRGCNTLTGSFTVDHVLYVGGLLTELDLRFEQHCEGGAPALRGELHWDAADATAPPGPAAAPPSLWAPPAGAAPATGNFVYLASEIGDYVGAGQTALYDSLSAALTVTGSGGHLVVEVNGDQSWRGDFLAMNALSRLEPGYYGDLRRYPFGNPMKGALAWGGEGRGCNTLNGWFVVDAVSYDGAALSSIALRFEQHCEGGAPALRGAVRWSAAGAGAFGGPVDPPPAGLWAPPPGATPTTGSFVHLASDPGDWVGAGLTLTYTKADALLAVTSSGGGLSVDVTGDESWSGQFQAMNGLARLEPGYYGNLRRYPFHNPARGGLSWTGEGRGCNTVEGWFVVDAVTYAGDQLSAIELRFEQRCEGGAAALHGSIRWDAADATAPAGPVSPPPAGLWAPAAGATPATGSYVYLASDPGDWVGAGLTQTYTKADALIGLIANPSNGFLSVSVQGDQRWSGEFQAMAGLARLEPGYYGGVQRFPFHNPVRGGLDWSGEGRGCGSLTGWFVVDAITYAGDTVTALDLRFEQRCDGAGPALHGAIHWDAADPTQPPGPVAPPGGLWAPPAGATPATGNYVYLQSDPGDWVGGGQTLTLPVAGDALTAGSFGGSFTIGTSGTQFWSGTFQAMAGRPALEPGYYGDLRRWPFHNPAKGGLSWSGQGRGCNTLTGWFVVDAVTYVNDTVASIDLRFEQHCEGGAPALHGAIHWSAGGT